MMKKSKNNKLLIVSVIPFWGLGGRDRFVIDFSNGMCRRCEVHIIAPINQKFRNELSNNINVIPISENIFQSIKQVTKYLLSNDFNNTAILVQDIYAYIWLGFLQKIFNKWNLYITFHSSPLNWKGSKLKRLVYIILSFLIKDSFTHIFVSKSLMNIHEKYNQLPRNRKAYVIYNGVDICKVKSIMDLSLINKPKNDSITIGYLGRIVKNKGVFRVVDVCKLVTKLGYKTKLLFVGDGPDAKDVKHLCDINDLCIEITGTLPHKEALLKLSEFDIGLLMSDSEGLPYSLMEMVALGCPVVALRASGVEEIVKDGVGILVENENEAAEAVIKIINNYEMFKTACISRSIDFTLDNEILNYCSILNI